MNIVYFCSENSDSIMLMGEKIPGSSCVLTFWSGGACQQGGLREGSGCDITCFLHLWYTCNFTMLSQVNIYGWEAHRQ